MKIDNQLASTAIVYQLFQFVLFFTRANNGKTPYGDCAISIEQQFGNCHHSAFSSGYYLETIG